MKIALLTPGGVGRDGAQIIPCFVWLVEQLAAAGDEVHVFGLYHPRGTWMLRGAHVHGSGGSQLRLIRDVLRENRHAPFAAMHAMWARCGAIAGLLRLLTGHPVLLHFPGGDLVRLADIHYGGRLSAKSRLALWLAARGANRIAAPSHFMVRQAAALNIRAEHAPFGVSRGEWPPREPRPRGGAVLRLLHVANLNPVKDQATLLQTAVHLRRMGLAFTLDVIGLDTMGGRIQALARDLGLDEVRFLGALPHAAVRGWMEQADILLVTSRHEAGPIVALEAAMAGIPTVGTRVGLLDDWAQDDACLGAAVQDAKGLADCIAFLAGNDAARLMLARRAQQRALNEDAAACARRIRGIYRAMCGGAPD